MADAKHDAPPPPDRRAVGIYDRPAKADRARNLQRWVWVVAALAVVLSLVLFLMRR